MRKCPNCKTMLEDDELFCHECGAKQEVEEVSVQNEETTAPLEKKCIHCGETIEADSAFCPYCGKSQETEEVKTEEPQTKKPRTKKSKAKKPETEESQTEESTKEESPKDEPKVEEPKVEEPSKERTKTEESQPEEEPTYEWEEEKKSKAWIWILLILLIAGGAGWYFFTNSSQEESSESTVVEEKKSEPVQVDIEQEKEEMLAFVKEFYLHYLDENYLYAHVTELALKKLRRDYPYECEEGDCLATWIFQALPHGVDMELEEGPVITQLSTGMFKVDFKYSYMLDGQKQYEDRSVRLYVAMSDGEYKITTYDYNGNTNAPRNDEERMINEIPEGDYNLSLADMRMILHVHDAIVEGEYYFQAGSKVSTSTKFEGKADNGLKLHLRQWNSVNKNDLGYIDGTFDGKTFKGEYDKDGYRHNFEVYVGGE